MHKVVVLLIWFLQWKMYQLNWKSSG